ncbi:hypothetical protein [Comamonas testosteroni]|uniref:hypothetical protein n=1 Tax=Comamonas testosteroni TaxID=285 RepID=UPI0005B34813|nr:hypothetical protein [Comamonas testosteroni]
MKSLLSFALAAFIFFVGFTASSRMQVFEDAKLIAKSGVMYEGRVSRDLLTGDYLVASHQDRTSIAVLPEKQMSGLVYVDGGITTASTLVLLITALLMLLIFGLDIARTAKRLPGATPQS